MAETKPEDKILDDILEKSEETEKPEETEEEKTTPEPAKKEEWFIPGKYKTKEDAVQNIKKQERYITELRFKNKRLSNFALGIEPSEQTSEEEKIKDEEFYSNPIEVINKKLELQRREAEAKLRRMRGEMILESVQEEYPNFDIEMNAKELEKELEIYTPEHRAKYSKQLLKETIEKLGGKKAKSEEKASHTEDETASGGEFIAGNKTGDIKKSILKVNIGKSDLFNK